MSGILRVRYRKTEEPHVILEFAVLSRERASYREPEDDEIFVNTETLPEDFFRKWREYEVKDEKLTWSPELHAKEVG